MTLNNNESKFLKKINYNKLIKSARENWNIILTMQDPNSATNLLLNKNQVLVK